MSKFKDQYDLLINNAKSRNWSLSRNHDIDIYTEVHHIVPRCMGGTDDKSNLVRLTGQEHFNAHMLLAKAYPEINGLILAAHRVSQINGIKITADEYAYLKENHAKSISNILTGLIRTPETCEKISQARKITNGFRGKVHTDETKVKISKSSSGKNNGMYGKRHTKEVCDNLSKIHSGKTLSTEHIERIKESNTGSNNFFYGKSHTESTKIKMAESWNNREILICPHCGISSKNFSNLKRWHFNNCKKKDYNDKQEYS